MEGCIRCSACVKEVVLFWNVPKTPTTQWIMMMMSGKTMTMKNTREEIVLGNSLYEGLETWFEARKNMDTFIVVS